MTKVLVIYYSTYGHVERVAEAVAEGARSIAGVGVTVKRVPELMPLEVARRAGAKLDQAAPIATPTEIADYDAILIGTPTRYGRMASQMANFLDQIRITVGKQCTCRKGGAFTSTATQHGGLEATLLSVITNLMHLGMVVVGLPYTAAGLMRIDEVSGGAPYGAATIAGGGGERQPSEIEIELGRLQGRHAAELASQLAV
jgi:NAD(P)H dehydrogenase (quinone)